MSRPSPAIPEIHSTTDTFKAIEGVIATAKVAHQSTRYGFILRSLPDWIVIGLVNINPGDKNAAAVLAYLTMRVGGVLHGKKNTVFDPENAVLVEAGTRVHQDICREVLRRSSFPEYTNWEPCSDPFAEAEPEVEVPADG